MKLRNPQHIILRDSTFSEQPGEDLFSLSRANNEHFTKQGAFASVPLPLLLLIVEAPAPICFAPAIYPPPALAMPPHNFHYVFHFQTIIGKLF